MTAAEFTLTLFCRVDDALKDVCGHPLAHLHPSEVVTLGLLYALRGGTGRAFYRWLKKELGSLFPRLPERTRLFRLFERHAALTRQFLAQPTLFGVCDTFGIELIHPIREGRSERQIGGKSKSNHRWIVGAKCFVLCNGDGQIVEILAGSGRVHDTAFHCVIENVEKEMIVLADGGFHAKSDNPCNLEVCKRGNGTSVWSLKRSIPSSPPSSNSRSSPTVPGLLWTPDSLMSLLPSIFAPLGQERSHFNWLPLLSNQLAPLVT